VADQTMSEKSDASKRSRVVRNAIILGIFAFSVYVGFILMVQSRG
jgi:hypothetical protein